MELIIDRWSCSRSIYLQNSRLNRGPGWDGDKKKAIPLEIEGDRVGSDRLNSRRLILIFDPYG
jgi:hypothetical protein